MGLGQGLVSMGYIVGELGVYNGMGIRETRDMKGSKGKWNDGCHMKSCQEKRERRVQNTAGRNREKDVRDT